MMKLLILMLTAMNVSANHRWISIERKKCDTHITYIATSTGHKTYVVHKERHTTPSIYDAEETVESHFSPERMAINVRKLEYITAARLYLDLSREWKRMHNEQKIYDRLRNAIKDDDNG